MSRLITHDGVTKSMTEWALDLGIHKDVLRSRLRRGVDVASALRPEVQRRERHGYSHTEVPTYRVWCHMRRRCYEPKNNRYHTHGGRGIAVCDRWNQSFAAFVADMGLRPSLRHSLDRINNDGNYEPGNCRWATASEQARNRRSNRFLTHNGKTQTVAAWADELGLPINRICSRLCAGDSDERALRPLGTVGGWRPRRK